ncbi:DUF2511 domain-containing protein [Limnothrix sp. FACHB-881]|jgi:hypothetical protein|uniref:DUF2511 domain-containing protein n=1 Tax=Limnothrix sp. FACHB-881 TaxID=2692819 RepID=UPI001687FE12|nr:DUF2511 domain-containing protein [Limnothrix sp. FACHB-881]MBD2636265.1 DUF2511 domain-containing protein [Limnothrix sp. FACHB-881]
MATIALMALKRLNMQLKIIISTISILVTACSSATSQLETTTDPNNSSSPPQTASPIAKTSSVEVTENEFGQSWPLTVPSGTLECVASQQVIFRANGKVYAVNGSAKATGALPIDPIWKDNPAIQGTKIPISGLLNRGLELCQ